MSSDIDSSLSWDDEWLDNSTTIGARKFKRRSKRRSKQQPTRLRNDKRRKDDGLAGSTTIGARRRTWQPKRRTRRQSARTVQQRKKNNNKVPDSTTTKAPRSKQLSMKSEEELDTAYRCAELMPYIYTPLPPDSQRPDSANTSTHQRKRLYTRVLKLYEGGYDANIEIDFRDVWLKEYKDGIRASLKGLPLKKATAPYQTYEALSYVWGSEEKPGVVIVRNARKSITITTNLDIALRHLRYPDRPRYLWIDALCIDQNNAKERSRQVSYMSHIFWNAPRVIIWLGLEKNDSNHALDTLEDIGSQIRVNRQTWQMTCDLDSDNPQWGHRSDLDIAPSARQWTAVTALIQREWFERLWIRQEVYNAGDRNSIVVCGTKFVPWDECQRGLFYFVCFGNPPIPDPNVFAAFDNKYILVAAVIDSQRYDLERLSASTVGALCKDPRDRIYALLGLLHIDGSRLRIVPDYGLSPIDLYKDVTLRHTTTYRTLNLLCSCYKGDHHMPGTDTRLPRPTGSFGLPSWVPDWSMPIFPPLPLRFVGWFNYFLAYAESLGHGDLRAAGVTAGPIQHIIKLDTSTPVTLADSIFEAVPPNAIHMNYPGGGNLWDAFRNTFCAGMFCDLTIPPYQQVSATNDLSLSIQGSKEAMRSITDRDGIHTGNFLSLVRFLAQKGHFFMTQKGYLGWGPKTILQGDQPISFLGCKLPILVREYSRQNSKSQGFAVIAPCYLHGFMQAEAFLGSLPDHIRPINHLDDLDRLQFHNLKTGHSSPDDPRLSTLSVDLEDFRRLKREGILLRLDLKPETWRARGVEVETFYLR